MWGREVHEAVREFFEAGLGDPVMVGICLLYNISMLFYLFFALVAILYDFYYYRHD